MEQNKNFLQQENFYSLLIGGSIPRKELARAMAAYQICLKGPYYLAAVLHIGRDSAKTQTDPGCAAVSLKKFAEKQLDLRYCAWLGLYQGELLLIYQLGDRVGDMAVLVESLDDFCRIALRDCDLRLTAGVGYLCDGIYDLGESYQGALDALSYRAIYGGGRTICIEEIGPGLKLCEFWEKNTLQDVLKSVRTGEREALKRQIMQLDALFAGEGISLQGYRIFVLELIAEIYRFGISNRIPMEEIFEREGDPTDGKFRLESPEKLWGWIFRVTDQTQQYLAHKRQNTTASFVKKAIEYVKSHYSDQKISIGAVCAQLGLSCAYFSTIFRRETGKTFISYLTDYRMERAAELLLTTDDRVYMIAEKTGYADPNYFSCVFKKKFNVSPSGYRKDCGGKI